MASVDLLEGCEQGTYIIDNPEGQHGIAGVHLVHLGPGNIRSDRGSLETHTNHGVRVLGPLPGSTPPDPTTAGSTS